MFPSNPQTTKKNLKHGDILSFMRKINFKIFHNFQKDTKQFLVRTEIPISSMVYLFKLLKNYSNAERK